MDWGKKVDLGSLSLVLWILVLEAVWPNSKPQLRLEASVFSPSQPPYPVEWVVQGGSEFPSGRYESLGWRSIGGPSRTPERTG